MLERFFKSPIRLRQLRHDPLEKHIDGLAAALQKRGYAATTATTILSVVGEFNRFARLCGVAQPSEIDEQISYRFLTEELAKQGCYRYEPSAMRHVPEYLRERGVIPRVTNTASPPADSIGRIQQRFAVCASRRSPIC